MEYKASLDTLAKVISTGVIVLFLVIIRKSVKAYMVANGDMTTIILHSGIVLLLLSTIVFCYLFSTQKYVLDNHLLIIRRPINEKRINISDITEVRAVTDSEMSASIRTFGVGGLFGYYGKFHNPAFGSMTWYTTQKKNRIFIRTIKGDKIIITPDDIGLLEKLQSEIKNKF